MQDHGDSTLDVSLDEALTIDVAENLLLDTALPKRTTNPNRENHRRGSSEPPHLRDSFDAGGSAPNTPDDLGHTSSGKLMSVEVQSVSLWDGITFNNGTTGRPHSADPLEMYSHFSYNETGSVDNVSLMDSDVDLGPMLVPINMVPAAYLSKSLQPVATSSEQEAMEAPRSSPPMRRPSSRDELKRKDTAQASNHMADLLSLESAVDDAPPQIMHKAATAEALNLPTSPVAETQPAEARAKQATFEEHSFDLPSPSITPKRDSMRALPVAFIPPGEIESPLLATIPDYKADASQIDPPSAEISLSLKTTHVEQLLEFGFDETYATLFRRWALCFCVVNFDLEIGQAIEYVYPEIEITESDRRNISFSAFPDSNSSAHIGDSIFAFRFRSSELIKNVYTKLEQSSTESLAVEPNIEPEDETSSHSRSSSAPTALDRFIVEADGFTYGYVFFRQQKDSEIRRGFFQKSLVLLSPHAWPGLFNTVMGVVGPKFMDALIDDRYRAASPASPLSRHAITHSAKQRLREAAESIMHWSPPPSRLNPDSTYSPTVLTLPLLGIPFAFSIPPTGRFPQLFETSPPRSQSTPSSLNGAQSFSLTYPAEDVDLADRPRQLQGQKRLNPSPVPSPVSTMTPVICCPGRFYDLFSRSLELLWVCWELIVLGEPILVMADTPRGCSDVVWGLIELIKPVPFAGDFRPYFTIQDSDFKGIAARKKMPPTGMIVGVTNPFFTKVFENWPHVLRVARFSSTIPHSTASIGPAQLLPAIGASSAFERREFGTPVQVSPASGSTSPNLGASQLNSFRSGSSSGSNLVRSPSSKSIDTIKKPSSPKSPQASTVKTFMSSFARNKTPDKGPMVANSVGYFVGEGSPIVVESVVQSLTSKYKPFLSKDKKLIKDVAEAAIRGSSSFTLNNMLRRHFVELTDRFLQPLNRHYEGLIIGSPIGMNLSCLRTKPEVKPFKQETFIKSIEASAPTLPVQSRRSIVELYRLFLKSPNFGLWLQTRTQEVNREWRRHYINVICDSDIVQWMKSEKREEIECVDLLLRIREEISRYARYFARQSSGTSASSELSEIKDKSIGARSQSPRPNWRSDNASTDSLTSFNRTMPSSQQTGSQKGGRVTFIPSMQQYLRLIQQSELLLSLLPDDLRLNVMRQDEEDFADNNNAAGMPKVTKPKKKEDNGIGRVELLGVSYDGRLAVALGPYRNTNHFFLWALEHRKVVRHWKAGRTSSFVSFTIAPNLRYGVSASAGGQVKVWDLLKGSDVWTPLVNELHLSTVVVAPNSILLGISSWQGVRIFDITTRTLLRTLSGHLSGVIFAEFAADCQTLVSVSSDKTARIWDLESGASRKIVWNGSELLAASFCRTPEAGLEPNLLMLSRKDLTRFITVREAGSGTVLAKLERTVSRAGASAVSHLKNGYLCIKVGESEMEYEIYTVSKSNSLSRAVLEDKFQGNRSAGIVDMGVARESSALRIVLARVWRKYRLPFELVTLVKSWAKLTGPRIFLWLPSSQELRVYDMHSGERLCISKWLAEGAMAE
ncbi:Protein dennd6a [Dinochytrium kinnereticum]|nr:Protein dennd6a [Dinochytrium kinnereticum]